MQFLMESYYLHDFTVKLYLVIDLSSGKWIYLAHSSGPPQKRNIYPKTNLYSPPISNFPNEISTPVCKNRSSDTLIRPIQKRNFYPKIYYNYSKKPFFQIFYTCLKKPFLHPIKKIQIPKKWLIFHPKKHIL